ncbi:MAG TPA: PLP-dependent aminotransferase family protein [Blastocatellia bacterium]|nr:PLP-dependent aminotransferase family protein [Blastocatellia bacterium]
MGKQATGAILPALDGLANHHPLPLYLQVCERIRGAILAGDLKPESRLPSTRTLAADLGVSRNTVEVAFSQLEAEGFLLRRVGAGSYVAGEIPEQSRPPRRAHAKVCASYKRREAVLSERGRIIVASAAESESASARAFTPCVPALDCFPFRAWHRLIARRSRLYREELLLHGEAAGYRPLREAVSDYLGTARAVKCDWRQVIILTSTQQAIELAARLLLDPGDPVWLEDPGYINARAALQGAAAQIVPVPVDDDGLNVEVGRERAPAARLAYVTPSHQYPTGVTMSLGRRLALLEWAARADAWVIEDDYDSEFRYTGRPLASVQGLDPAGRVIYTGTFNKVMFPALRLAYLVVPGDLVDKFTAARTLTDGCTPGFMQAVMADFIAEGHFGAHIRRMRNIYRERREVLLESVARHLGNRLRAGPTDTGLHVAGWLQKGANDQAISERAAAKGLDVPPLSRYYLARHPPPGLLLNYASVTPKAIQQGIRTLASVL